MYKRSEEKELSLRWGKVQRVMERSGVEAVIVSDNTSLSYLSGRVFSGVIYLPVEGVPIFFVRRPIGLSGDHVAYMRKVEEIPTLLAERGVALPKNIALEGDTATFNEFKRQSKIFALDPKNIFASATQILRQARSVKTPFEIEQMRYSGVKHSELYAMIPSFYRSGMSDLDLTIELEYYSRKLGSIGSMRIFGNSMEAFVGSVLVGDNADSPSPYDFALGGEGTDPTLPVGCNGTMITEGTTIMVDQGGTFTPYLTDMTRVFSCGEIPEMAYRAHQVALEMQYRMEEMVCPGSATADIYNMCLELAKGESLAEYFMGHKQQSGFVGHGVGREVNEVPVLAPRSRELFEEGNTFAFEPKFVIPGVGAVGIENTFAVTDNGTEKLTLCEESIVPLN